MRHARPLLWLLPALLLLAPAVSTRAQPADDRAGFNAAAYLLEQAGRPYQDGRHNALLRGLRQLGDDDLRPYFAALSNSGHAPQRVHGLLGLAELSPDRRIDLAALAEIDDDRERIELLSAAMDDDLIDAAGLSTLLQWDTLDLSVKQAVALRLLAEGGSVDAAPFHASLDLELDDSVGAGRLLQYGLGALVMAESGDAAGSDALQALGGLHAPASDAVLAQLIDAAMRRDARSAGPVALSVSADGRRDPALRMLGVQAALRLQADGAAARWQAMFDSEPEPARRTRLAMIALDAAPVSDPALYDTLAFSDDPLLRAISQAGRAIAAGSPDLPADLAPLLVAGQPLATSWVVAYCQRQSPTQQPALLEAVIRAHRAGEPRNRARLIEAAVNAARALCELHPDLAADRLPDLLNAPSTGDAAADLQQRQLVLLGIARSRGADLSALARAIDPDTYNDFTTRALRLLIRARYNAPLTADEWAHISDLVQGVGQIDLGLRVQLAWLYLEHQGRGADAIESALRASR